MARRDGMARDMALKCTLSKGVYRMNAVPAAATK